MTPPNLGSDDRPRAVGERRLIAVAHAALISARNLPRPVVAVGWNSERFDGYNLALRLKAIGFTNVFWYRAGREAWEVANMPEAPLKIEEW